MGCWNETCAVTRTPIFCGEDVVMVVVGKMVFKTFELRPIRFGDSYEFVRHVDMIAFGKYNDYGWLEGVPDNQTEDLSERRAGGKEAYERAIFFRRSVWDGILKMHEDDAFYVNFTQQINLQKLEMQMMMGVTRSDEFWEKMHDFLKIFLFCENVRIDILSGLAHKGSQNADLEKYVSLLLLEKMAYEEWKKRWDDRDV